MFMQRSEWSVKVLFPLVTIPREWKLTVWLLRTPDIAVRSSAAVLCSGTNLVLPQIMRSNVQAMVFTVLGHATFQGCGEILGQLCVLLRDPGSWGSDYQEREWKGCSYSILDSLKGWMRRGFPGLPIICKQLWAIWNLPTAKPLDMPTVISQAV